MGWIPFDGSEKVLEIGAGPGAITGVLTERCGSVDCVDLSRKRSLINAYRHRNCSNLTIHVGNFEDIEPELDRDYDYVFLIGVLEYAGSYLHSSDPFGQELRTILSHVKPGGRVVIAIENRIGLKYWAGCAEDHSGRILAESNPIPQRRSRRKPLPDRLWSGSFWRTESMSTHSIIPIRITNSPRCCSPTGDFPRQAS